MSPDGVLYSYISNIVTHTPTLFKYKAGDVVRVETNEDELIFVNEKTNLE
jgi:hypothetical protein